MKLYLTLEGEGSYHEILMLGGSVGTGRGLRDNLIFIIGVAPGKSSRRSVVASAKLLESEVIEMTLDELIEEGLVEER